MKFGNPELWARLYPFIQFSQSLIALQNQEPDRGSRFEGLFLSNVTSPDVSLPAQPHVVEASRVCVPIFIVDKAINIVMIFFAGSVRNPLVWKLSIPAPQKVLRLHAEGWAHAYYSRDSNKTDADGELFMLKDPRCTVPLLLKLNLLSPWWPGMSIPVNLATQEQIEALFQNRNKNRSKNE
jgi:hypothetical protein